MFSRHVLSSCRRHPNTALSPFCRSIVTEAVPDASIASSSLPAPIIRTKRLPRPQLTASVILNRSPIITRTPTAFERAYYAYQARIRRALHNPFPYEFYFKQGSLLETRFNIEERRRERRAFGPGFAASDTGGGEKEKAAEQLSQQEGEGETMMPRVHPTDTNGDLKSLDRKGKRNVYLLLLTKENGKNIWRFPQGGVERGELLHQAAQRDLHAECGAYMDTWIVSRNPIGVYRPSSLETPSDEPQPEKLTFFFKAHIMAGQVRPEEKTIQEFAWLTKQEIETRVEQDYWLVVKDILSDF